MDAVFVKQGSHIAPQLFYLLPVNFCLEMAAFHNLLPDLFLRQGAPVSSQMHRRLRFSVEIAAAGDKQPLPAGSL